MGNMRKKIANAEMRGRKIELESLLEELFEDVVVDSRRNKFLIGLITFCVDTIITFIKKEDVKLL